MAIQFRRGSNAQWEANRSNILAGEPAVTIDTQRVFVGTDSGEYVELVNISNIASEYNTTTNYAVGDLVIYHGVLLQCNTPTSGAFVLANWDEATLGGIIKTLQEEIERMKLLTHGR